MTIKFVNDNILNSNEQYIIHSCNCVTKNSKGLAKSIFDKFNYANTYKTREKNSIPGTIDICGNGDNKRYIINLYSQIYPGSSKYSNDTKELRLKWFNECLIKVSKIENLNSIAIPYNISCGLAGGNWNDYNDLIIKFDKLIDINIVIYKL